MLCLNNFILSPKEAFEYRWNASVNIVGGIGNNIPDDNACELAVKAVKGKLRTQGPNLTFESAKVVCDTLQAQQAISDQMVVESGHHPAGHGHARPDKTQDVLRMSTELQGLWGGEDTRWVGFRDFVDPLSTVKIPELHKWMENRKAKSAIFLAFEQ